MPRREASRAPTDHRCLIQSLEWLDTVVSSCVLKASDQLRESFSENFSRTVGGVAKERGAREELSAEAFPHKADLSLHEHIDYEGVWLVVRTGDRKRYLMSP